MIGCGGCRLPKGLASWRYHPHTVLRQFSALINIASISTDSDQSVPYAYGVDTIATCFHVAVMVTITLPIQVLLQSSND